MAFFSFGLFGSIFYLIELPPSRLHDRLRQDLQELRGHLDDAQLLRVSQCVAALAKAAEGAARRPRQIPVQPGTVADAVAGYILEPLSNCCKLFQQMVYQGRGRYIEKVS